MAGPAPIIDGADAAQSWVDFRRRAHLRPAIGSDFVVAPKGARADLLRYDWKQLRFRCDGMLGLRRSTEQHHHGREKNALNHPAIPLIFVFQTPLTLSRQAGRVKSSRFGREKRPRHKPSRYLPFLSGTPNSSSLWPMRRKPSSRATPSCSFSICSFENSMTSPVLTLIR